MLSDDHKRIVRHRLFAEVTEFLRDLCGEKSGLVLKALEYQRGICAAKAKTV
jgi:hypothetical protein